MSTFNRDRALQSKLCLCDICLRHTMAKESGTLKNKNYRKFRAEKKKKLFKRPSFGFHTNSIVKRKQECTFSFPTHVLSLVLSYKTIAFFRLSWHLYGTGERGGGGAAKTKCTLSINKRLQHRCSAWNASSETVLHNIFKASERHVPLEVASSANQFVSYQHNDGLLTRTTLR